MRLNQQLEQVCILTAALICQGQSGKKKKEDQESVKKICFRDFFRFFFFAHSSVKHQHADRCRATRASAEIQNNKIGLR